MRSVDTFRPSGRLYVRRMLRQLRAHAAWAVRERWPERAVVREVQGVRMTLPWSHRLPDYARGDSPYGQNLVQLAALLGAADGPVTVLDVGANIGDSALQILHATDARVLCVEADASYTKYLHINLDAEPRATIVEAFLSAGVDASTLAPERRGGTTRYVPGQAGDTATTVTAEELRDRHPDYQRLRLAKSDTDGHDVVLVPAIARAWSDSHPVCFFEYDPALSRACGNDPESVWDALGELGYQDVAIWDNGGRPLGRARVADMVVRSASLDRVQNGRPARRYWDVAVAHADDDAARTALDALMPGEPKPSP